MRVGGLGSVTMNMWRWMRGKVCRTAAGTASLLLTSGLARCEVVLHGCGTRLVCLVYPIATVVQLYHGDMMYEMRRKKPEPTSPAAQGIFNLQHHIGVV